MSLVVQKLNIVLADTYTLYLKTQNHHWHVKGPHFVQIHKFLEEIYDELSVAVDEIAERIVILGHTAPGSFKEYLELTTLTELKGTDLEAKARLQDQLADHQKVLASLKDALEAAGKAGDTGTEDLLTGRISAHEKTLWMIRALLA